MKPIANIDITRYLADVPGLPALVQEATRSLIERNAAAIEATVETEFRKLLYKHLRLFQRGEYEFADACVEAILDDFRALIRQKVIVTETDE